MRPGGSHPRGLLAFAGVALVAAAVYGLPAMTLLKSTQADFQAPSSQYERARRLAERASGQSPYWGVVALVRSQRAVREDPDARRAAITVAALLSAQPGFQRALDYPRGHDAALLSRAGHATLVLAAFATPGASAAAATNVRGVLARIRSSGALSGIAVRFGGPDVAFDEVNRQTIQGLRQAELIGFPVVFCLSFLIFGGLVAALLQALTGGAAILIAFACLRTIDQVTPVSVLGLNLATGLGLGLGIDYSLFVISRFREELAGGSEPRQALARTLGTAGRTVLYSSLTVAGALCAMLAFPLRVLWSMGLAGAITALAAGAVALLLLPAALLMLGERVNALSPRWLSGAVRRSARPRSDGAWARLSRAVMARPVSVAALATVVLLAAGSPVLRLRLAPTGADLLPSTDAPAQVEAALAKDFAHDPAGAIGVLARAPGANARVLERALNRTAAGQAAMGEARRLRGSTVEIDLLPRGSPDSARNQRLVQRLRAAGAPYGALVGGQAAAFIDEKAAISAHIPAAIGVLGLATALFLFAMTGSLLLPIKAFVLNLLSLAVGAGLLVLIFQQGHLSGPLGFTPIGGLEEGSLVLMCVLAWALSTDYEVFVLGRVKESFDAGRSNRDAVAAGMERTGRLVTAAAVLFCIAVGVLAVSPLFFTKQFAVGTALVVLIDASVVRALLVPALMALMGAWNWWAPQWLRRASEGRARSPARSGSATAVAPLLGVAPGQVADDPGSRSASAVTAGSAPARPGASRVPDP